MRTVSDELAAEAFPLGDGLQSVIANLVGRRICGVVTLSFSGWKGQRLVDIEAPRRQFVAVAYISAARNYPMNGVIFMLC